MVDYKIISELLLNEIADVINKLQNIQILTKAMMAEETAFELLFERNHED